MKKLKILLTGGGGFIGKNFLEQRNKKYQIFSPTHGELDFLDTEAVKRYFIKKGPFDVLLHTAIIGGKRSEKEIQEITETNLRIFFNLIRNGRYFRKMIHFGSGAEYDKSQEIKDVKEMDFDKRIPADSYGFYKYVTAKCIEHLPLEIYHLRLFGVYGKYEDYRLRLTSNLLCKYLLKLPLTMMQNAYFDYLYIDDLVKILDYFIEKKPKYKFYNITSGEKISLLTISKKINRLASYSMPIDIQKKGLNKEYTGDNRRLIKELKRFTFSPIDEGLQSLFYWYKQNLKSVNIKAITEDSCNKI